MREAKLAGIIIAIITASFLFFSSSVVGAEKKNNENKDKNGEEQQEENSVDKILLCHRTESDTNPWEVLELPEEGLEGHDEHDEDIIPITDRNEDGKIDEADCSFVPGNGNGNGNGQGGGPTPPPVNQITVLPAPVVTNTINRTIAAAPAGGIGGGPVEGFGGGTLPETGGNMLGLLGMIGLPALAATVRRFRK